jgi:hypothetical protein
MASPIPSNRSGAEVKYLIAFASLAFAVGCGKQPAPPPPAPTAGLSAADVEKIVDDRVESKLAHIRTSSVTIVDNGGKEVGTWASTPKGPALAMNNGDLGVAIGATSDAGATVVVSNGKAGSILGVDDFGGNLTSHNANGTESLLRASGMVIRQDGKVKGSFIWTPEGPVGFLLKPNDRKAWGIAE